MFDSTDALARQIRMGEDSMLGLRTVHFAENKITAPGRDDIADELAAFANARGGVLVLGVDEKDRDVVGIHPDHMDYVERFVSDLSHDLIDPPIDVAVSRIEVPNSLGSMKCAIRVEVQRSPFVHLSPSGYYRRVGSSKRQMSTDHLARLFQQRSQSELTQFDASPVPGTSIADIDGDLTDRFLTVDTHDSRDSILRKLGIVTIDLDGVSRLSVAGTLLCTSHPHEWLPHAYVQAVAYAGNSVGEALEARRYQLDAMDATGPLDIQVKRACAFVGRNQRVSATKWMGRKDFPSFDMTAVFEAMVNAVAHRDYSFWQSKIRLQMYSNRLELYVPGALANGMTPETLAFRQATRNEIVAGLLAKCSVPQEIGMLDTPRRTLMDRRGEGVGVIMERSTKISEREPVYEMLDEAELRLTIYAAE